MFESYAALPSTASSISLSIINISANLSHMWNCKAKNKTVTEISDYLAKVCPELLVMDFTNMDDYDNLLRDKAIQAARMKDCADAHELGKCDNCPFV